MEPKQPLQQMVLGDLDSYMQKNETRSPNYTIHKINSRYIKDLSISRNTIKVLEEKLWQENLRHSMQQYFHQYVPYDKG